LKKSIAVTLTLLAGVMMALVGCASVAERSAQDDTAAMMLNYPWVAISNTTAFGNGPMEDVAAVTGHYTGSAFYAVPGQPSSDLAFATSQSYW